MTKSVKQCYNEHSKSIDKTGRCTAAEISYLVSGVTDEDDALATALEMVSATCRGLSLDGISIDARENSSTYRVNVLYKSNGDAFDNSSESDAARLSFDCSGGTRHVNHAISQRRVFGNIDAGTAIGWNGKLGDQMEVLGVDMPTAQMREVYEKTIRKSRLNTAFKRKLARMTGAVNSRSFKGWNPGEVMFMGASFSAADSTSSVMVSYNFAIQENENGAEVAGINIGNVQGWEYIWPITSTAAGNNAPGINIDAIYVAKVAKYADLNELGV